jgi:hypothetical protein
MANKKMGKVMQMLSPENYIRKKARELPVYECLVNLNWDKTQLANLVVARRHTNGNITAGLYLVDLGCLGVKDTFWFFNIPEDEYRKNLERMLVAELGVKKIDYLLAHNIVFAGVEFADDYGFKPHKDFTSLTRYILDDDNDDIPIMDIECGIDGMPAIVQGPNDDDKAMKKYIAQLEREAGPGNYMIIGEGGKILNEEEVYDDRVLYAENTFDEKAEMFSDYLQRYDQLNEDETIEFYELVDSMSDNFTNDDMMDKYTEESYRLITPVEVMIDDVPDELLGAEPGQLQTEIKHQFVDLIKSLTNHNEFKQKLKLFEKIEGIAPAIDFAKLINNGLKHPQKYGKEFENFQLNYPDYPLGKLKLEKHKLFSGEDQDKHPLKPAYFFGKRNQIHDIELFLYLDYVTHSVIMKRDFNRLIAWKNTLMEFQVNDEFISLISLIALTQIEAITEYLETDD